MKTVFVSAFMNTHQLPLSEALNQLTGANYSFIETVDKNDANKKTEKELLYLFKAYKDEEYEICREKVNHADVVIAGSVFDDLLRERIQKKKLIFRYSERPLKNGIEPVKYIPRYIKWNLKNPRKAPIYMLCASAFTALDYSRYGLFRNKCYKWGYFPKTRRYEEEEELYRKKDKMRLIWCGRLLKLKHPDDAVRIARMLRDDGIAFSLKIIGAGEMEAELKEMIQNLRLQSCVEMTGAMNAEDVRKEMENAGIFLFTSDRYEGWGAVLNEAMNSGCAVVASDAIGSVPYLLKNNINGLIYHSGDVCELYQKVRYLLDKQEEQKRLGNAAYHTISDLWNAELAAERLLLLAREIQNGNPFPNLFEDGPCSRAPVIKENWYEK